MKDKIDGAILLNLMYQQALDAGVHFYDDQDRQLTTTKEIFKTLRRTGYVKADAPPIVPLMVGVAK